MTVSLKHAFNSGKSDSGDASLIQPSNWNAEHTLVQATARLLGRTTAGTGATEEISVGSGLSLAAGALTATGGSGSPGGSDTQIQFNDAGSFAGDGGLTYDKATDTVTITDGSGELEIYPYGFNSNDAIAFVTVGNLEFFSTSGNIAFDAAGSVFLTAADTLNLSGDQNVVVESGGGNISFDASSGELKFLSATQSAGGETAALLAEGPTGIGASPTKWLRVSDGVSLFLIPMFPYAP